MSVDLAVGSVFNAQQADANRPELLKLVEGSCSFSITLLLATSSGILSQIAQAQPEQKSHIWKRSSQTLAFAPSPLEMLQKLAGCAMGVISLSPSTVCMAPPQEAEAQRAWVFAQCMC